MQNPASNLLSAASIESAPFEETPCVEEMPFVIEHRQEDRTASGAFRPSARLLLTPALRTSGLWAALPAEELRDLVLLLTFLTPNGRIQPTLPELAQAMHATRTVSRTRLLRLTKRHWQGQPLVRELPRPSGLDAYLPASTLLNVRDGPQQPAQRSLQQPPQSPHKAQEGPSAPLHAHRDPAPERRAGRDALIAHSRARYAAPRAEVEADIARRMGWGPPAFDQDPPEVAQHKQELYDKLFGQGMSKEQALDVLERFDLGLVGRQLDWLPLRGAKNPARYLLAAIENNYEPPVAARQARMIEPD